MKRTWKTNIYGNTVGYEGQKRVQEFGNQSYSERLAMAWCNGMTVCDAEQFALSNPDFKDYTNERK